MFLTVYSAAKQYSKTILLKLFFTFTREICGAIPWTPYYSPDNFVSGLSLHFVSAERNWYRQRRTYPTLDV